MQRLLRFLFGGSKAVSRDDLFADFQSIGPFRFRDRQTGMLAWQGPEGEPLERSREGITRWHVALGDDETVFLVRSVRPHERLPMGNDRFEPLHRRAGLRDTLTQEQVITGRKHVSGSPGAFVGDQTMQRVAALILFGIEHPWLRPAEMPD